MEEFRSDRQLRKMDILKYNAKKVEEVCTLMPHEERVTFEKTYGRILDLLKIYVEPSFIRVLVYFWNAELHCFELPQFDLVPTLEEYEQILRWPRAKGVYTRHSSYIAMDRVASLIKLSNYSVALTEVGKKQGWKITALEKHLEFLAYQKDWVPFGKTVALIIFGMVLLPIYGNMVDHASMDAFFAWDAHRRSPLPAILADTLLAVNFCATRRGKTFRGCSSLLYVWGITHFYTPRHPGGITDPLRSFSGISIPHHSALEWKEELEHWEEKDFTWTCPWFCVGSILMRCGDFPNIPLVGLRGCISYSPRIAMRQLSRTQTVPTPEELKGFRVYHDDEDSEKTSLMQESWERPIYLGDAELGKARLSVSTSYQEWRNGRGVPQPIPSKTSISTYHEQQAKIRDLSRRLETTEAQLRASEEKEQESDLIIDSLKRQCLKKDHEIERLKDQCADINEEVTRATKAHKPNPDSHLMQRTAEIAHLESQQAKQTELIEQLQESLRRTQVEAQHWKGIVQKQSLSFRTREREGLAQYDQVNKERVQAINWAHELEAQVVHYKEKAKAAQDQQEEMGRAVLEQAGAMRRHVQEAEDEWERRVDVPVGFFGLLRYCQKLLRSIV